MQKRSINILTMDNSPVLCFEHCQKKVKICCIIVPKNCPLCGCDINSSPMRLPPFRLPTPFSSSKSQPFSLIIKPTNGSFLQDYKQGDDLHIGISNSNCDIYSFDQQGLCIVEPWLQCLVIPVSEMSKIHPGMLDKVLNDSLTDCRWIKERYNESQYNCYTYVLDMLLRVRGLEEGCDKVTFSSKILLPSTTRAASYVDLYRRIMNEGYVISYALD